MQRVLIAVILPDHVPDRGGHRLIGFHIELNDLEPASSRRLAREDPLDRRLAAREFAGAKEDMSVGHIGEHTAAELAPYPLVRPRDEHTAHGRDALLLHRTRGGTTVGRARAALRCAGARSAVRRARGRVRAGVGHDDARRPVLCGLPAYTKRWIAREA